MNLIKMTGFILIVFGFSSFSHALNKIKAEPKTDAMMLEFLDGFIALKKYLVSDAQFENPKNYADITLHLKKLAVTAKKTSHDPLLNQENFKFSREVLEEHLTKTQRVFKKGNKSYARWMTNSTMNICMSCHTQMPTRSRGFPVLLRTQYFSSEFDQAEFMFATRDFENANKVYQKIVTEHPRMLSGPDRLEKSIQRVLVYQVRIKRDLNSAKASINLFKQNKDLPDDLKKNLAAWDEQLTIWQKKKLPDPGKINAEQISQFAKENGSFEDRQPEATDPNFISNLIVSSLLYEFLQKQPPSSETPAVLYWLARIERKMDRSAFYSLADLYLKECIIKFPASTWAAKCYEEYEEEMVLSYTGSAGTNVPHEVLQNLKYLKKFVESKGKIKKN